MEVAQIPAPPNAMSAYLAITTTDIPAYHAKPIVQSVTPAHIASLVTLDFINTATAHVGSAILQ